MMSLECDHWVINLFFFFFFSNKPILESLTQWQNISKIKVRHGSRRNKNLHDHLIKAKISKPRETIQGNPHHHSVRIEHCHYKGCRYCPKLDRVEQITSQTTGKKYTVRQKVDCKSNNLVYIFTCPKCGQQYVGETKRTLGEREWVNISEIFATLNIPH